MNTKLVAVAGQMARLLVRLEDAPLKRAATAFASVLALDDAE